MFEAEFILKQKAQLKYLEVKSKKMLKRKRFINSFSHEFLWSLTPIYYFGTALLWVCVRKKFQLKQTTGILFLAIPPTIDYFKRDYYVRQFPEDLKNY